MPWLRAVASRISYDVAATDWQLLVERRSGRAVRNRSLQVMKAPQRHLVLREMVEAGEVDVVTEHPLLDLLNDFNPVQTGLNGRRVTQLHMDLVGEAFWLLERDALGTPAAIWPVPPNWILGTPTPRFPFFRVSFRGWQGTIPATEFVWFTDVDPSNPYGRGTGTAQALADELETDEFAAKHIKAFYHNSARPDLIIFPKGETDMKEDQVRRLEEQWTRHSGGFWRAWRPFFLRREVEVKALETSFRSQQMVQLREFERNTVLEIFGVAPETLGIIAPGSSRATITMSDAIYGRRVLVPRLEALRSVQQERLVPQFDERLILDYVSPVTRDQELELKAGEAAPWSLSVDEWRAKAGERALPDDAGKVHMVPFSVTPTRLDEPVVPPSPVPSPRGVPTLPMTADADVLACREAGDGESALTLEKFASQAESNDDDPVPTRIADRGGRAYMRAQERAWRTWHGAARMDALGGALAVGDVEAALDALGGVRAAETALTDVLLAHGRPMFLRGAELALAGLPPADTRAPIAVNLADVNPEATRWAQEEGARLVRNVGADARAALQVLIIASNEEGIAPADVARRIVRDNMVGLLPRQVTAVSRYRAQLRGEGLAADVVASRTSRYAAAQLRLRAWTIVRTELVAAVNSGQDALWQLARQRGILPAGTQRVWLVTYDDLTCEEVCAGLQDAVAGLDEPFPGGYMRPPAHPRCRCAIGLKHIPRRSGEDLGAGSR